MFLENIEKFIFDDINYVDSDYFYLRIYRWNPYLRLKPWFNIFPLKLDKSNQFMVLDLLFYIKNNYDSTLTFRRSCREGICGSCSMNINGTNTLACLKTIKLQNLQFLTIYPLPHFLIVKDLICDLTNFYSQYRLIKPWLNKKAFYYKIEKNIFTSKEKLQIKKDRLEIDGLYECILCACCSASCPSYWWNYNRYFGPAILLQAYRWILDSRDSSKIDRIKFLNNKMRVDKCHGIMNCSKTCPKNLNPAKTIYFLKYFSQTNL